MIFLFSATKLFSIKQKMFYIKPLSAVNVPMFVCMDQAQGLKSPLENIILSDDTVFLASHPRFVFIKKCMKPSPNVRRAQGGGAVLEKHSQM